MFLKELPQSKICPNQRSDAAHEITNGVLAQSVVIHLTATKRLNVFFMILETSQLTVLWISLSPTPSIAAPNAERISTLISLTWLTIIAGTPGVLSIWQCGWLLRTAYPTEPPHGTCGETTVFLFPGVRFRTGSRQRGKKAEQSVKTRYLDEALTNFSGYIAVDELYDGPFCVLSIVDNHNFRRLTYDVLERNPTNKDIITFFRRFKLALNIRRLKIRGITTDGSPLYPEPIAKVFGDVSHQICEFHVIKEINKAIIKALAQERRQLRKLQPKLSRGRPAVGLKRSVTKKKRLQNKIADLFEYRYLFVAKTLSCKEKKIFTRITRGLPQLRTLRSIMDEVYRLFDRRCRTETALQKLAKLRRRVKSFKTIRETLKKLFTSNIEKALTFLDDSLLPSTSNAVERGNRRHRKMQKSIYRVRTAAHISQRIAVDMHREGYAKGRLQTTRTLHRYRRHIRCSR